MKTLGNILWFILTGLWMAIMYCIIGVVWCITIIGIPFGKQAFKFAKLSLFPFGKTVTKNFGSHPVANVIWIIFGGFSIALGFCLTGVLWCITIIGIPFGKQCFKFASLAFGPFGATIEAANKPAETTQQAA